MLLFILGSDGVTHNNQPVAQCPEFELMHIRCSKNQQRVKGFIAFD